MQQHDSDGGERHYDAPVWRKPLPEVKRLDAPARCHIGLPDKVAVKYLADVSGLTLRTIVEDMERLRIFVSVDRSVDFDDAARVLLKYGIKAHRQG
jgi:hypothetical protein